MKLNSRISYQKLKQLPPWEPEEVRIARKILTVLMIGLAIPAFFLSTHGLYYVVRGAIRYAFRERDFKRELRRLEKKKFISLTKTPDGLLIRLLKKGLKQKRRAELAELKLPVAKTWDKKWRLFIFDIPEENRKGRDLLRMKLKELGLHNIQRSVFVYPYDCRKELQFIAEYYAVGKYTTYAETNKIDIDRELRKYFNFHKID